jgi:hypothetical protein
LHDTSSLFLNPHLGGGAQTVKVVMVEYLSYGAPLLEIVMVSISLLFKTDAANSKSLLVMDR